MENQKKNEIKIDLSPEVAGGHYSNLAVISHSPGEFFIDFIAVSPNMGQAKVQSRIIINPENAKNLMFTLQDNIRKYEQNFGEIKRTVPVNNGGGNNNPMGGNGDDIPNPFMA